MRKKSREKQPRPRTQEQEPRRTYEREPSNLGLHTVEMPVCGTIPPGMHVVDSRGAHAVSLAYNGLYLGLFLRR